MVICTPPSLLKVFLKLQFHPKRRRVGFMYNLLTFFYIHCTCISNLVWVLDPLKFWFFLSLWIKTNFVTVLKSIHNTKPDTICISWCLQKTFWQEGEEKNHYSKILGNFDIITVSAILCFDKDNNSNKSILLYRFIVLKWKFPHASHA